MLKLPDDVPMSQAVGGEVLQANPHLANMTVGDFRAWTQKTGGNASGGYQAPQVQNASMQAPQGPRPASPDVLNRLWRSGGEGRQLAGQLIQEYRAGQQGPIFRTMQGPNGAIFQVNTQTGEQSVLMKPQERDKPPAAVQEYEYYVGQQQQAGQPALSFEEYERSQKSASAPKTLGSIPPGYSVQYDANGNPVQLNPIPGSPAALEVEAAQRAEQNRQDAKEQRSGLVVQEIDRALSVMDDGLASGAGWQAMLSGVPGTEAKRLASRLETIKANIGFDELQKLREQSPTGGALGQVTERELAFLQSVAGSLDQAQSPQDLKDNLNRLWNAYQDVIHGPGNGPARRPLSFQQGTQSGGGQRLRFNPATGEVE